MAKPDLDELTTRVNDIVQTIYKMSLLTAPWVDAWKREVQKEIELEIARIRNDIVDDAAP